MSEPEVENVPIPEEELVFYGPLTESETYEVLMRQGCTLGALIGELMYDKFFRPQVSPSFWKEHQPQ